MTSTLLLIQLGSTWFMVGLIWLIQIVHYPLFVHVGEPQFSVYAAKHQRWITWIVAPIMTVEFITAAILAWHPPSAETAIWLRMGFVLATTIWCSTALVQSRQHGQLTSGFKLSVIESLVLWNWIRTITWTARGVILLVVMQKLLAVKAG